MNEGEIDLSSDSPPLLAEVSGSRDVTLVITKATMETPTLAAAADVESKTAAILIKQESTDKRLKWILRVN